ncbi:MAG: DUF1002 domain-containing protein [Syntrophomonadaceae bacterium]
MQGKSIVVFLVVLFIVAAYVDYSQNATITGTGSPEPRIVISLGQDLDSQGKNKVMQIFSDWQNGRDAEYITVSNTEEREYLQGLMDERAIGTRAISSAYVELLENSHGIEVQTKNITAITPFMYANALTTAGIENARVIVAAPFEVSGTAALTGITKAFESAQGENLDENAKKTAHQEIAETSRLGEKIGQNSAERIIYETKRHVLKERATEPAEIRKILVDVSNDLNVSLSEEDKERIVLLMQKIGQLDISISRLNDQLRGLERNLVELTGASREATSLFQQLIDIISRIIQNIRNTLAW